MSLLDGIIVPQKQFSVVQTASVWTNSSGTSDNFSFSRAPTQNCLMLATSDAFMAAYAVTQTGYEWQPLINSAPTSAYGDAMLWIGKPTGRAAPGTLLTISGNNWFNAFVVEINNLKGELVWTNSTYNTTTTVTVPGINAVSTTIKNTPLDSDLWVFTAGRMKSGGSGVTSITSSGIKLLSIESGNWALGMAAYGKYVPGSSPSITHNFSRSTNCSAFMAILR